ncbi:MAG TPA: hypothetical protein VMW83_06845 [Spirochaetia bacterium]|nr:hypothetical protein [Spirochaetia bacterium]
MHLTEKEKLYAKDQLRTEQLCAKKAGVYLHQVQDPALRDFLGQFAQKSQQHVQTLQSLLGPGTGGMM